MDDKHKYSPTQKTMKRWYYKVKYNNDNIYVKQNYNDKEYIKSYYYKIRNICLVTDVKKNFCEIEYNAWIHKNNLIKLEKGPNGEDLGVPYFVEATGDGKVVILPVPGYHILSNNSNNCTGYYFIFSLYDPYY
jgi:hypothetical protein